MAKLMKKWQRVFWLSVMCLLLVVGGVNVLSAHAAYSPVYNGSYGSELTTAQKGFYNALKKQYYDEGSKMPNGNTNDFTYTLSTPITFIATISNGYVVHDENYQEACEKLKSDLEYAYWAFVYDYPEVFWLGNFQYDLGKNYSISDYNSTVGSCYLTIKGVDITISEAYSGAKSQIGAYRSGVESAKASVQSSLKGSTRYDQVKAIHDWVCKKAVYNDAAASDANNAAYEYAYSSGTVFAGNANVVCEGYAESFKVLCDQFNIPAALVVGHGVTTDKSGNQINKSHMWVYVQMEDGKWYAVDPTWDDQKIGLQETYLLVGANTKGFDSTFKAEHTEVNNCFSKDENITYTYPTLSANAYSKSGSNSGNDSQITLATPVVTLANDKTGVKVSWKSISGASGYYVYRKTGSEKYKIIETVGSSTLTYTDETAVSGTTYYYMVRAYKDSTKSEYKGKSIKYLSMPDVEAKQSGDVKVTWTNVVGASGYKVYRKTASGKWSVIATVSSSTLSYTDKEKLVSGETYYYTAKAYSGSSNGAYQSTSALKYLSMPTVTVANTSKGVNVKWTNVVGASGYKVYRKTASGKWSVIATVSSSTLSYTDKEKLVSGETYYYTAKAYSGSSNGAYQSSPAIKYMAKQVELAAPMVSASVEKVTTGVKVTWDRINDASGYYVYRKTEDGKWSVIATVKSGVSSYTDKTVSSGTTYYYTVRAYNGSTKSAYKSSSAILYLSTTKVTAAKTSAGIKVTWSKVTGASGYYVYRKTANGKWAVIKTVSSGATTSYVDKTAKAGTTYFYTIRAYHGSYRSYYISSNSVTR